MRVLAVVSTLKWGEWIRGVIGAAISGGAGSLGSGLGASVADPAHDINIFKVMWITFLISATISLAKYLHEHPLPDQIALDQTARDTTSKAIADQERADQGPK